MASVWGAWTSRPLDKLNILGMKFGPYMSGVNEQPEARFERLLALTKVILWEADAQTWKFTYIGPQVETLLGYPPEQWYEKDFWVCHLHPEDRDFAINFCETSSKTLTDFEFEYRMIAADGRTVWINDVVNVVTENGTPQVLQGFLKDVTERKEADSALRKSREQLIKAQQVARMGFVEWNLKTNHLVLSDEVYTFYGITPGMSVNIEQLMALVHPDDHEIVNKGLDMAIQGLRDYDIDYRIVRPDGNVIWVHSRAEVKRDKDGIPSSLTGTVVDITERKTVENELRESRALLDSYIGTAPVGMAMFDSELRYRKVNQALADINGVSIEDHLYKRPRDILPGSLGLTVEKIFQSILRTGQPIINQEISGETLSHPDETRHWLHSFFPILGAEQKPSGIGVTIVETTEIKRAEEQLRQSQKMEALGTLSGGIAHDFNNILYPIVMYANLLLEKCDADSQDYKDLKEITSAVKRATDLVSQILVFSRRSTGVKHVRDLVLVIKEAIKLMRAALPANITLEEKIPDGIVPVFCDSSQLYQVVVDICTNAGLAILESGKITIALDSSEVAGIRCFDGTEIHGKYCRLTVTDSGVGMDNKTQAKIFDPFFTTRDVGRGTGLGLSTVFGIVQDHKGGIKVSSEVGKGSTFEVFLPIAEGPVEKEPETRGSVRDYMGTENILFVDDDKQIRNSVRICLERAGYNVTAVADGQEALDIFEENIDRYDLVVTDQTMPNMTGEQLSHELMRLRPNTPVILCTGHGATISAKLSGAAHISAFLQKPLTPTDLRQVVRKVLDEASI